MAQSAAALSAKWPGYSQSLWAAPPAPPTIWPRTVLLLCPRGARDGVWKFQSRPARWLGMKWKVRPDHRPQELFQGRVVEDWEPLPTLTVEAH